MIKVKLNSNYGYDSNGTEIDESTVEELARVADEVLYQSLGEEYGFRHVEVDADSFKAGFYNTGTAFGADVRYKINGTIESDNFDLTKCYNEGVPNLNTPGVDIAPNSRHAYAVIDFTIDVHNQDMEVTDLEITIFKLLSMDFDEYDTKRAGEMFSYDKISDKLKAYFDDAVADIQYTVSNI